MKHPRLSLIGYAWCLLCAIGATIGSTIGIIGVLTWKRQQ